MGLGALLVAHLPYFEQILSHGGEVPLGSSLWAEQGGGRCGNGVFWWGTKIVRLALLRGNTSTNFVKLVIFAQNKDNGLTTKAETALPTNGV